MIGTVVVPLDGSELAEQALPYGRAVAQQAVVPLHLLSIVPEDASEATETESYEYLRAKVHEFGDRTQISVHRGDAAREIIDAAEEMPDPVIVMTTHGRSGVRRLVYGSVAEKVVRDAGVPVLLLRQGTTTAAPPAVRTILAPVDGSGYSEAAIPYAIQLAKLFDAEIRLARVAETARLFAMVGQEPTAVPTGYVLDDMVAELVAETQAYLDQLAQQVRGEGVRVQAVTLEGVAADQLLAYERSGNADLIVMATRGRSGIGRFVFGSVAERVLKSGQTPVMMIKPDDANGGTVSDKG